MTVDILFCSSISANCYIPPKNAHLLRSKKSSLSRKSECLPDSFKGKFYNFVLSNLLSVNDAQENGKLQATELIC